MGSKKTLLLINGSQVLMSFTQKILERADYAVYCVIGSVGAREILMDISPDAILLEKELPGENGIEFCRELRRDIDAPIMLMSADKEDELIALQAGANDFLRKPYDYDVLVARIGVLVNKGAFIFEAVEEKNERFAEIQPGNLSLRAPQRGLDEDGGALSADRKARPAAKHFLVAAAAFIIIALTGVATFFVLSRPNDISINDGELPLSGFPFESSLQYDGEAKTYIELDRDSLPPVVSDVTITAGEKSLEITLVNPADNAFCATFEIALEDGETLYLSGLVKPGMYIDGVVFTRALDRGAYDAVLIVSSYETDGMTVAGRTETPLRITAG